MASAGVNTNSVVPLITAPFALEVAEILESDQRLTYTFYALDPPAGFTPNYPLTV